MAAIIASRACVYYGLNEIPAFINYKIICSGSSCMHYILSYHNVGAMQGSQ